MAMKLLQVYTDNVEWKLERMKFNVKKIKVY